MAEPGKVLEDIARIGARDLQGGVHQSQEGMRSIEKQTGEESQPTNPYVHGRIAPVTAASTALLDIRVMVSLLQETLYRNAQPCA